MKLFSIVLASISLLFIGCSDKSLDTSLVESQKLKTRTFEWPEVNDGILTFNDENHFDDYVDYLSDLIQSSENPDSTLNIEEQRFSGFTSLRKSTYKDSLTNSNFTDYINSDFIFDIVIKSIMNLNYEYAIGTSVYVHTGLNQVYKINDWDEATINAFRHSSKGDTLPPVQCYSSKVEKLLDDDYVVIGSTTHNSPPITPRSLQVRINRDARFSVSACDTRNKVLTAIFEAFDGNSNTWPPYPGSWLVNWGDNSYDWNFTGNLSQIRFTHYYFQAGVYNGWIQVTYNDPDLGQQQYTENITIAVNDRKCKQVEHEDHGMQESGDWRMVTRIWFHESLGWRQGAETEAWHKNNHGNWFKKSTDIEVYCGAKWYDGYTVNNCSYAGLTEDSDDGNSRHELVHMKNHFDIFPTFMDEYQSDQTISTHRLQNGQVNLTQTLYLNECN
jgi:hypothetical protein